MKFLKFWWEEQEELNFEVIDFSLCSPRLLFKFIDCLQEECKLGRDGGRLGYIDAISELIDFRKVNGASDGVLRRFMLNSWQYSKGIIHPICISKIPTFELLNMAN